MTRIIFSVGLTLVWAGALWASDRPASSAERPSGTGVIVHSDGYVLTAYHVVANARRVVVVTPGEFRASAIVVSTDAEHDLALLKAETVGLSEASLGHAGAVQLDQEVLAVGFPFGLREVSLTRGRIAAVRTKGVQRVFQVDAAVNPGNSGGPLFNAYGELIGILTTKFSHPSGIVPEGMAFAVPVSYATPLLANIEGFDFTMVGKKRNAKTGKKGLHSGNLAPMVVRTTVRIEIARAAEGTPAPADSAKQPDAVRSPIVQAEPRGPGSAQTDQAMIRQVNEQLRALQEEELQRLAQRGIAPPEGMVLVPAGEFLMGAEDGLPDLCQHVLAGPARSDQSPLPAMRGERRLCAAQGPIGIRRSGSVRPSGDKCDVAPSPCLLRVAGEAIAHGSRMGEGGSRHRRPSLSLGQ
jgi:hypothetical protein